MLRYVLRYTNILPSYVIIPIRLFPNKYRYQLLKTILIFEIFFFVCSDIPISLQDMVLHLFFAYFINSNEDKSIKYYYYTRNNFI